MRFTPASVRCTVARRCGIQQVGAGLAALLLVAVVGCAPLEAPEEGAVALSPGALTVDNGIITNGIITNGIITNGIITNGLTTAQLGGGRFTAWFDADREARATLMSYLVRCAVPEGETRAFTHPTTGVAYTWQGALGLAPGWAAGSSATLAEQQVVTACLLAHVNKFGVHVNVSLVGAGATGTPLPYTAAELADFSEPEGCFFGNGFVTGGGLFSGSDHRILAADQSSSRACALRWASGPADCAPITHVGTCWSLCTKDASGTYYTSCTYNGVTYKPLTTRIRPAELFRCGDGVCQVSERCGGGTTADSCAADCGACP
ncbi:hypothetical protein P2318_04515 [Myxococcaceae bacterium GXIMD 01537]